MHYKETKTILTPQNGINIYRGCTNNCIYCDARSKCYRLDHEFTDVEVKKDAYNLLEGVLKKKRNKGLITTGIMSDPYMGIEEELRYMRKSLQVIERYDFGIVIRTKSKLILRDIEILESINHKTKALIEIPFSSADDDIARKIDGEASGFEDRVSILAELQKRRIPCIMVIAPVLPRINDSIDNLSKLLDTAGEYGVYGIMHEDFGVIIREGSKEHFLQEIGMRFPEHYDYYMENYSDKGEVVSENKEELRKLLNSYADSNGIVRDVEEIKRFKRVYDNKTVGEQLSFVGI